MLTALLLACQHAAPPAPAPPPAAEQAAPPATEQAAPPIATELDDGGWIYTRADGSPAFDARYGWAFDFDAYGHAVVRDDHEWLLIDTSGHTLLHLIDWDNGPDFFEEGLARYLEDGRMGFFDERGQVIIPARFEYAWPFQDGVSKVGEGCTFTREYEHTRVDCARWWHVDHSGAVAPAPGSQR